MMDPSHSLHLNSEAPFLREVQLQKASYRKLMIFIL